MSQACTCDRIRAIGWCPVHRPPATRDAERREATDREIVRVVRSYFASDRGCGAYEMLFDGLEAAMAKEGEGTR